MKAVRLLALVSTLLAGFLSPGHAPAQSRHEALTPAEIEEVRESTDYPAQRLKLYMRFLDERSARIAELKKSQLVEHRGLKLHDAIEQLTLLIDEMQNNLDEYEGYETNLRRPVPDLRKTLPLLQKSEGVWRSALADLPANEDYNFVLETCNQAEDSLKDQTAELITSQQKYFIEKKKADKANDKEGSGGYVLP